MSFVEREFCLLKEFFIRFFESCICQSFGPTSEMFSATEWKYQCAITLYSSAALLFEQGRATAAPADRGRHETRALGEQCVM